MIRIIFSKTNYDFLIIVIIKPNSSFINYLSINLGEKLSDDVTKKNFFHN